MFFFIYDDHKNGHYKTTITFSHDGLNIKHKRYYWAIVHVKLKIEKLYYFVELEIYGYFLVILSSHNTIGQYYSNTENILIFSFMLQVEVPLGPNFAFHLAQINDISIK